MKPIAVHFGVLICSMVACDFPRPADVPSALIDAGPGAPSDAAPDTSVDAAPDTTTTFTCTANEFIACDASGARICNAAGDGTLTQDCGLPGCNSDAKRCNQCIPDADTCNGVVLDRCGPDGLPFSHETCLLECKTSPRAHCARVEPQYLPNVCDVSASLPDLVVDDSRMFDTTINDNCMGGVITQISGPEICVVHGGSIRIASGGSLTAFGSRALALVADRDLIVDGILDVSANGTGSGPGGASAESGDPVAAATGGGGAGFATVGAPGGSTSQDGGGGHGGLPATNPALVSVLIGGTRPTRRVGGAPAAGGAGGAATLIACRGPLSVSGTIDAGGGGGQGGRPGVTAGQMWSGAGGGSGGYVALQGLSITVTGLLYSNGGGGGAGWVLQRTQTGQSGEDGTRSTT
ncbi:MAG TPA: hypothetical protein VLM79_29455, partial [Kofleriaceae bacterium]|nr:hypothetical protein [Kofleriaceae bacterium]